MQQTKKNLRNFHCFHPIGSSLLNVHWHPSAPSSCKGDREVNLNRKHMKTLLSLGYQGETYWGLLVSHVFFGSLVFSNLHVLVWTFQPKTCDVAGNLRSSWWDFWADRKSSILRSPFFLDQIGFRSLWIRLFQVWSKVYSLDFETSNQQSWR